MIKVVTIWLSKDGVSYEKLSQTELYPGSTFDFKISITERNEDTE